MAPICTDPKEIAYIFLAILEILGLIAAKFICLGGTGSWPDLEF